VKSERKVGAPTRSTLFSSDVAYDINDTTRLNFVTGYIDLSQAYVFDLQDGRPGRSLATPNPATPIQPAAPNGYYTLSGKQRTSQVSQDVRLAGDLLNGAIEYTAGLSYLDARERADTADIVLGVVEADRLIKNRHRVAAAYLSTDLHVTQNFTFAAGIRYTIDKKRLDLRDLRDAAAVPVVAGVPRPDLRLTTANLIAAGRPDRQKEKGFSPRVTLSYAFGPDALTYVSATRGIRAGGWNVHGRTVDTFTAFAPERAWTYEAGAKTSWLGEALTANVAVFNTDITDKQVSSTFTTAAAIPSYTTANPSNYRVRGLETEVQARPFDGFLAYANLAYQSASNKSPTQATSTLVAACRGLVAAGQAGLGVCGTSIVTPAGLIAKPVRAPKFSGTAGLSVDMPTGFGIVFAPAFSLTYQSRWQNDAANTSFYASADPATTPTAVTTRPNATGGSGFIAGSRSGSVYLLNASLAVGTDDGLWRGVLECTNCLGKTYATSSIAGHSFLNEPMRWGVRIKRSF
jgi:iron complex outermembrane receptor protein